MIKKFSSPKMRNREFVFTPKIEYELVAELSEPFKLAIFFVVPRVGLEPTCLSTQHFKCCACTGFATAAYII